MVLSGAGGTETASSSSRCPRPPSGLRPSKSTPFAMATSAHATPRRSMDISDLVEQMAPYTPARRSAATPTATTPRFASAHPNVSSAPRPSPTAVDVDSAAAHLLDTDPYLALSALQTRPSSSFPLASLSYPTYSPLRPPLVTPVSAGRPPRLPVPSLAAHSPPETENAIATATPSASPFATTTIPLSYSAVRTPGAASLIYGRDTLTPSARPPSAIHTLTNQPPRNHTNSPPSIAAFFRARSAHVTSPIFSNSSTLLRDLGSPEIRVNPLSSSRSDDIIHVPPGLQPELAVVLDFSLTYGFDRAEEVDLSYRANRVPLLYAVTVNTTELLGDFRPVTAHLEQDSDAPHSMLLRVVDETVRFTDVPPSPARDSPGDHHRNDEEHGDEQSDHDYLHESVPPQQTATLSFWAAPDSFIQNGFSTMLLTVTDQEGLEHETKIEVQVRGTDPVIAVETADQTPDVTRTDTPIRFEQQNGNVEQTITVWNYTKGGAPILLHAVLTDSASGAFSIYQENHTISDCIPMLIPAGESSSFSATFKLLPNVTLRGCYYGCALLKLASLMPSKERACNNDRELHQFYDHVLSFEASVAGAPPLDRLSTLEESRSNTQELGANSRSVDPDGNYFRYAQTGDYIPGQEDMNESEGDQVEAVGTLQRLSLHVPPSKPQSLPVGFENGPYMTCHYELDAPPYWIPPDEEFAESILDLQTQPESCEAQNDDQVNGDETNLESRPSNRSETQQVDSHPYRMAAHQQICEQTALEEDSAKVQAARSSNEPTSENGSHADGLNIDLDLPKKRTSAETDRKSADSSSPNVEPARESMQPAALASSNPDEVEKPEVEANPGEFITTQGLHEEEENVLNTPVGTGEQNRAQQAISVELVNENERKANPEGELTTAQVLCDGEEIVIDTPTQIGEQKHTQQAIDVGPVNENGTLIPELPATRLEPSNKLDMQTQSVSIKKSEDANLVAREGGEPNGEAHVFSEKPPLPHRPEQKHAGRPHGQHAPVASPSIKIKLPDRERGHDQNPDVEQYPRMKKVSLHVKGMIEKGMVAAVDGIRKEQRVLKVNTKFDSKCTMNDDLTSRRSGHVSVSSAGSFASLRATNRPAFRNFTAKIGARKIDPRWKPKLRMSRKVLERGLCIPADSGSKRFVISNGSLSVIKVEIAVKQSLKFKGVVLVQPQFVVLQPGQKTTILMTRLTSTEGKASLVLLCSTLARSSSLTCTYRLPVVIEMARNQVPPVQGFAVDRPTLTFYNPIGTARHCRVRVLNGTKRKVPYKVWISNKSGDGAGESREAPFGILSRPQGTVEPQKYFSVVVVFNTTGQTGSFSGNLHVTLGRKEDQIPIFGYCGCSSMEFSRSSEGHLRIRNKGSRYGFVILSGPEMGSSENALIRTVLRPGQTRDFIPPYGSGTIIFTGDEIARTRMVRSHELFEGDNEEREVDSNLFLGHFDGQERAAEEEELYWAGENKYSLHYAGRLLDSNTRRHMFDENAEGIVQYQDRDKRGDQNWMASVDVGGFIHIENYDSHRDLPFTANGAEPKSGCIPPLGDAKLAAFADHVDITARGQRRPIDILSGAM